MLGAGSTSQRSGSDIKQELINKAQADLAHQERSYHLLKTTMSNFKDSSVSTMGKLRYATSSIPHQAMVMKKSLLENLKEH